MRQRVGGALEDSLWTKALHYIIREELKFEPQRSFCFIIKKKMFSFNGVYFALKNRLLEKLC